MLNLHRMFDLHDRLKTVRIWLVRDVIHVIVFAQFYRVLKPTCESLFDYFWRWQDVHITENVCCLLKRYSETDLKKY